MRYIFAVLLCAHNAFASTDNPYAWEATYTLVDGSTITHRADCTILNGQNAIVKEPCSFQNTGIMQYGTTYTMNFPDMNGYPLIEPLILETQSPKEEFLCALIQTGLYNPTAAEQRLFDTYGNWEKTYSFPTCQFIHCPDKVLFVNNSGPHIQKTLTINNVIFPTKCTKERFESKLAKLS